MKQKLSLCMIVRNESEFLSEALSQAKSHCDEIIVVDTGSTDDTVTIAKHCGAKVFHFEWVNDFAAARNFSIQQATGDWILVLDADERVTEEDWEKLKNAICSDVGTIDSDVGAIHESPLRVAFDLLQINYSLVPSLVGFQENILKVAGFEKYPGFTESRLTRLFRNGCGFIFEGVVHEHLCKDGKIIDGESLPVCLHHHGQALSPERLVAKKRVYLKLGMEKARRFPEDFKNRHELGVAHWDLGDFNNAEQEFLAAREICPGDSKNLIALGTVIQLQGRYIDAESVFRDLINRAPGDLSAHAALGCCLKIQDKLDEAITAFKRQIEINPEFLLARQWLADCYAQRRIKTPSVRPTLSVCYIVKNEADCLGRSLENVSPHCDEIIVVDTGSNDGSQAIAERHGAKVFQVAWRDDFALARNRSLQHATSEWILVLDADEVLGDEDWSSLKNLVSSCKDSMVSLVQTTYCNQSTVLNWKINDLKVPEASGYHGYFESALVRLFRNTPRIRFHGAVHEHARCDDGASSGEFTSHIRIHHYGKFREPERMREKYDLYHKIGVQKTVAMPNDAQAYYELAVQLMELRIDDGVDDNFKKALALNPNFSDAIMAYANYLLQNRRLAESLDYFMKLITLKPKDPQTYVFTASLLIEIGKHEIALRMLETARDLGGDSNVALLMNEGVIHLHLRNDTLAEACFRRAYALNKDFVPVLINLGIVLTRTRAYDEAEIYLRRASELDSRDASAQQKLGELLFLTGRTEESLNAFLAAQKIDPSSLDILSQIVTNAHLLGRIDLVENFEGRLVALSKSATNRSALDRIAALYEQRHDEVSSRRLATLLDNRGAF